MRKVRDTKYYKKIQTISRYYSLSNSTGFSRIGGHFPIFILLVRIESTLFLYISNNLASIALKETFWLRTDPVKSSTSIFTAIPVPHLPKYLIRSLIFTIPSPFNGYSIFRKSDKTCDIFKESKPKRKAFLKGNPEKIPILKLKIY